MLGSAELPVVGVLNLIATDLQVSVPSAGTLVTADYGLFMVVAFAVAMSVVPPERMGRAISGFAVPAPLGTLVGQARVRSAGTRRAVPDGGVLRPPETA